jgi:hypothetical protein
MASLFCPKISENLGKLRFFREKQAKRGVFFLKLLYNNYTYKKEVLTT